MRIFGSERLEKVLSTLGMEEGEAIVHPWVNKSLERAQSKVEGRNFDIRKQLLKFDDVMNDQRKVIFSQRREIMEADDLSDVIKDMRDEVIDDLIAQYMPPNTYADQWDTETLQAQVFEKLGVEAPVVDWAAQEGADDDVIRDQLETMLDEHMAKKAVEFGPDNMRSIEKQVILETIDGKWRDHLLTLEHLRSVVGFRGYAQRDPLNEYKSEAFQLFEALLDGLRERVSQILGHARMRSPEEQQALIEELQRQQAVMQQAAAAADAPSGAFDENNPATWGNPGRNDQCPCGSGKKFKHCHGKV